MTFPELMCCMWAALGTNERFSAGTNTALMMMMLCLFKEFSKES
jgi:hypothetical protein